MIQFRSPSRYIVPLTNFGFERFFGRGIDDSCLLSMLNSILELEDQIKYIQHYEFSKPDPRYYYSAEVRELHCTLESGEEIIVQLENCYRLYSIDLSFFTFACLLQNEPWHRRPHFPLPRTYTISFLHFNLEQYKDDPDYKHTVKLTDVSTGTVLSDRITHIYIEMEKFKKKVNFASLDKVSDIDDPKQIAEIWLYLIKNLSQFEMLPRSLDGSVFEKFFERANTFHYTESEKYAYFQSLMAYLGIEKMAEVERQKRLEFVEYYVKSMIKKGVEIGKIAEIFELTEKDVKNLVEDLKTSE